MLTTTLSLGPALVFAGAAVLLALAVLADRLTARRCRGWDADFRPAARRADSAVRIATRGGWRP